MNWRGKKMESREEAKDYSSFKKEVELYKEVISVL